MKKDKVTVVTVAYNAADCIEKTILSVIGQTYSNIEYIIIDGKSTDGTLDLVNKYSKKISKVISEKDNGIFDAMNKGISYATGDWIIFMNAGDTFYDDKVIEKILEEKIDDNVGVIHGEVNTTKGILKMVPFYKRKRKLVPMGICHQSIFVRNELAKRILFDRKYKVAADYNMIHKIYEMGYKFLHKDIVVANYDLRGFSARNTLLQYVETAEICMARKNLSYYLLYAFVFVKSIIKRILIG